MFCVFFLLFFFPCLADTFIKVVLLGWEWDSLHEPSTRQRQITLQNGDGMAWIRLQCDCRSRQLTLAIWMVGELIKLMKVGLDGSEEGREG